MKNTEDSLLHTPVRVSSLIMEHCPSCYETLKAAAIECHNCGVVLDHFQRVSTEKRLKLTIGGLYHLTSTECMELEAAWHKVESIYFDQNLHNQFLHKCLRMKSLPYAVKKYSEKLAKEPLDDIASTMKHRAMLLASESLPGKNLKVPWVSSVLAQSLLRTLTVVLILGVCAGSVLMLTSVLTTERFFFLFMGFFVTLGSLMSYILLQRLQRSLDA